MLHLWMINIMFLGGLAAQVFEMPSGQATWRCKNWVLGCPVDFCDFWHLFARRISFKAGKTKIIMDTEAGELTWIEQKCSCLVVAMTTPKVFLYAAIVPRFSRAVLDKSFISQTRNCGHGFVRLYIALSNLSLVPARCKFDRNGDGRRRWYLRLFCLNLPQPDCNLDPNCNFSCLFTGWSVEHL